jgi:preprotein translocase subunit SecF
MEIFVNANYKIMEKQKYFVTASVALIAIGLICILLKGGLRYGIDFSGGTIVQIQFSKSIDSEEIRGALKDLDIGSYTIQSIGRETDKEFLLRLPMKSESSVEDTTTSQVTAKLEEKFGKENTTVRRTESVGPAIGRELRTSAMWAIMASLIMMLIYITFRFEFKYGIGAIVALIHDILITLGALSLTNREIDMPTVAALLTIVGYSVNDTIVVFDRVRENIRLMHKDNMKEIFNRSINQTFSRTILTSLTVVLVLIAMYFFGGEVINTFSFALLVGVITGTYSSIYIASPYALFWANLEKPKTKPSTKK